MTPALLYHTKTFRCLQKYKFDSWLSLSHTRNIDYPPHPLTFLLLLPTHLTQGERQWLHSKTQLEKEVNWNQWVLNQIRSDQLLSRVRLFVTPWITARQASLSITNYLSSLRLTSIESVMPPSHLILCRPLLLLPPIPPSIRVFSNESTLCMRWSKYKILSRVPYAIQ